MNRCEEFENAALAALVIIEVSGAGLLGACAQTLNRGEMQPLHSTIAFVSTRHDSAVDPTVNPQRALLAAEIYLMNGDGTNPRRLTENNHFDGFPALSSDGSRIVFDSNRLRSEGEPFNTSDLFVMSADGSGETHLIRGSSATWSPDGKRIAYTNSVPDGSRQIFAIDADGKNKKQLTKDGNFNTFEGWYVDDLLVTFWP